MEFFLCGLVVFSVLIQGGYFPTVFLLAAVGLAVAALVAKKRLPSLSEGVLWLFSALYLGASLAHGYQADSLAQACLPLACALFLSVYCGLSLVQKQKLCNSLVLSSAVLAGLALAAFSGVVPLTGAVTAHRLQFTFQYANAAGAWFAAISLLAQDGESSNQRRASLPCIAALLLTRSIGALGLYGVLQIVRLYHSRSKPDVWKNTVVLHALAGLFAVAFYFLEGWLALPVLVLLYVAAWYIEPLLSRACGLRLHWAALAVGVCGGGTVLLSSRVTSSLMTFAERLTHIRDGTAAIAQHPLLGVGAGSWAQLYPYYQSAQYTSTVVHSGPIQIGIDSGLAAVVLALVFLVLAWKNGKAGWPQRLAAALLVGHSLLDFTLQFFPIDALLLVLLFSGTEPEPKTDKGFKAAGPVCMFVAAGVLCAGMLYSELQTKQLIRYGQSGRWDAVVTGYEGQRPLFGESQSARECYLYGLYAVGDLERVVEIASSAQRLSTDELLLQAQVLWELDRQEEACQLLLSELEQQWHRVTLFERTAQRFLEWGVDETVISDYNRIVDLVNEEKTTLGTLQGNQVEIDHITIQEDAS